MIRTTSYYLRLSCWLFVCFACFSFYTFRPVSKYFASLPESVFSMYQISTFDNIQKPINDVKQYLTDGCMLYFLVYFLMVGTAYTTTMLSFFTTYYSTDSLQVDFKFEPSKFIYANDMAEILDLSMLPSERWYMFKEAEMYLAGMVHG